ncbi:MAG TPA: UDP binding domain-containing protein, partial [Gemmatimonadaceae bacterium]|nr:UDP binding domain-containing protein [Gemmatimonadaceae bacterium]
AVVDYHDPLVPHMREGDRERHSVPLTAEVLRGADAVVVVTDHDAVDYQLVADEADVVVDTRNVMTRPRAGRARVVPLASTSAARRPELAAAV